MKKSCFTDDRHCDWRGKCRRKPYMDVFPLTPKPEKERQFPCDEWIFENWSYLCFWHFQYERIRFKIKRWLGLSNKYLGYGYAETTEEYLLRLKEEENDKYPEIDE